MPDMKLSEAHPISKSSTTTTTTKQKERHIVTWTQQEDDILREQIGIHGTENWGIIAAKFNDKTTRQCRRRWYTYLNSDFKKGGWSPEEDMLLCEPLNLYLGWVYCDQLRYQNNLCMYNPAQRIFGNRWTEIAKVVSGRTDNAVKNRFTTLCKKRAKRDALSKENKSSCTNPNNKRSIVQDVVRNDTSESAPPQKKMRMHIPESTQNQNFEIRLHRESGRLGTQQLRHPFAVLVQNSHSVGTLPAQQRVNDTDTVSNDGNSKAQATFLRRDDPKITALMQQAELLTSLAVKVNTENTDQSLESAWKELQNFLNQANEDAVLGYKISDDFQLDDLKDLVEDLKSFNVGSLPSWRQPDLYESPGSSEYSTGSTLQSHTVGEKMEQSQAEVCSLNQEVTLLPQPIMFSQNNDGGCEDGFSDTSVIGVGSHSIHTEAENGVGACIDEFCASMSVPQAANLPSCNEPMNHGVTSDMPDTGFSSPMQVTPLFQTYAAGIPTPKFSESERNFLLKTLGMAPPSPKPSPSSHPPPCRRALLQSL